MSFIRKISNAVLKTVGASEFAKDGNGKPHLTEEQRKLAVAKFGADTIAAFEKVIASDADNDAQAESFLEMVRESCELDKAELNTQLAAEIEARASAEQERDSLAKMGVPHPAAGGSPSAIGSAKEFKIDMAARHNALVAGMFKEGRIFSAADNPTLDVTELNKEFSIAMPPKQRIELVNKSIYRGFPDHVHMTRIQSDTDYIATSALITSVVQEFTDVWTPKGSTKFSPIRIPYRRHKINVPIKPTEVIKSWLLYLYEQDKTFSQMPITKYIIDQHILPKIQDDLTRKMVGKGKYEAAPAGQKDGDAGRDAAQSMDGIETQLCEAFKAGTSKMNFYKNASDLFKLTGQEFLDAFHAYVAAISKYFVGDLPIHCCEQMVTHYNRQDFAVNGKYTGEKVGTEVRFTGFKLVPLLCMYNSPILFATPKLNFIELVDINSAQKCIQKIEEHHYNVDILGEFALNVGFRIGEAVFAYVPKDYNPTSAIIADDEDITAEGSVWTNGGVVAPEPNPETI